MPNLTLLQGGTAATRDAARLRKLKTHLASLPLAQRKRVAKLALAKHRTWRARAASAEG
jgi:hypothetical protein